MKNTFSKRENVFSGLRFGLRVQLLKNAGALYEDCQRKGILDSWQSDMTWMAGIGSRRRVAAQSPEKKGTVAAPWPEIAGVLGHGYSGHQTARDWDGSTAELKVNSPSSKMEAESSHGRCAAAEGGRRFPVYGGDHERANQSTKKKRERFGISERTTWSSYDGLWRGSSGENSESTATAAA